MVRDAKLWQRVQLAWERRLTVLMAGHSSNYNSRMKQLSCPRVTTDACLLVIKVIIKRGKDAEVLA